MEQGEEYKTIMARNEGLELADSITVDGHKMLNVVRIVSVAAFTRK